MLLPSKFVMGFSLFLLQKFSRKFVNHPHWYPLLPPGSLFPQVTPIFFCKPRTSHSASPLPQTTEKKIQKISHLPVAASSLSSAGLPLKPKNPHATCQPLISYLKDHSSHATLSYQLPKATQSGENIPKGLNFLKLLSNTFLMSQIF